MFKIAHRGYSEMFPDNTIPSFQSAIKVGFDMIELDIQLCKNNEIVVFHDTYLDLKLLSEITIEECREHGMISLEDFFDKIDSKQIKIYLDLKGNIELSKVLLTFLISRDLYYQNIYIASFNRKSMRELQNSNLPLVLGFTSETGFTIDDMSHLIKNYDFFCVHWTVLDDKLIDFLHKNNKKIFTYTAKETFILNYMKQFNVDGIVSNFIF